MKKNKFKISESNSKEEFTCKIVTKNLRKRMEVLNLINFMSLERIK